MSEPTRRSDTSEATAAGGGSTTGMPRWVKISLIVVGTLIAIFVFLQLIGVGGQHGPSRHIGPSGLGGQSSSSNVTG